VILDLDLDPEFDLEFDLDIDLVFFMQVVFCLSLIWMVQ